MKREIEPCYESRGGWYGRVFNGGWLVRECWFPTYQQAKSFVNSY